MSGERVQARIMSVGKIVQLSDGSVELLDGWSFDPSNGAVHMELSQRVIWPDVYIRMTHLWGYSVDDLRYIAAHPAEFVDST